MTKKKMTYAEAGKQRADWQRETVQWLTELSVNERKFLADTSKKIDKALTKIVMKG